jgi:sterol desaturase/sphingolipid hydroxylase (fatty acid hydroxylase superfamily)
MSARDPLLAWKPEGDGDVGLRDCVRVFARCGSPRVLAAAGAAALTARIAIGHWSRLDLVVCVTLVALQPLHEWLIHVGLLHAKPRRLGRLVIDLPSARIHRLHHRDPTRLRTVLLPAAGVPIILGLIAIPLWVLTWPLTLVGGDHRGLFLSAGACGVLLVIAYEWCHFLIHSPYRPRSRYYKAIWRSHRLHHFKNEHYWFGVSSNAADRVLRTNPDHRRVSRSSTARNLAGSERSWSTGNR